MYSRILRVSLPFVTKFSKNCDVFSFTLVGSKFLVMIGGFFFFWGADSWGSEAKAGEEWTATESTEVVHGIEFCVKCYDCLASDLFSDWMPGNQLASIRTLLKSLSNLSLKYLSAFWHWVRKYTITVKWWRNKLWVFFCSVNIWTCWSLDSVIELRSRKNNYYLVHIKL